MKPPKRPTRVPEVEHIVPRVAKLAAPMRGGNRPLDLRPVATAAVTNTATPAPVSPGLPSTGAKRGGNPPGY